MIANRGWKNAHLVLSVVLISFKTIFVVGICFLTNIVNNYNYYMMISRV